MNTRERIIALLSKSREPLAAKSISFELKKGRADIRKILSNLYKEGKINKVAYGFYTTVNTTVNMNSETVNLETDKLIREARNAYQREHKETRKAWQRKNYAEHREEIRAYQRNYYQTHIAKMREFNRKYYKLYPEKRKEYERRYWLKRALREKTGV